MPTKGHWPKGKRRNPIGNWASLRRLVVDLLDQYREHGIRTASALAGVVGVDHSTVGRWLRGDDVPSPESMRKLGEWVDQQRASLGIATQKTRPRTTDKQPSEKGPHEFTLPTTDAKPKCRSCGKELAAGELIYYVGSRKLPYFMRHIGCERAVEVPKTPEDSGLPAAVNGRIIRSTRHLGG